MMTAINALGGALFSLQSGGRRFRKPWEICAERAAPFYARQRTQKLVPLIIVIILLFNVVGAKAQVRPRDATEGAQLYRACAACHSLTPDRNMTGPSLAGVWGRKAGSL